MTLMLSFVLVMEHLKGYLLIGSARKEGNLIYYDSTYVEADLYQPESEEYDSLGGYVFHALGRIPRPGETMSGTDFLITVQTASARRLETLRIQKKGETVTGN